MQQRSVFLLLVVIASVTFLGAGCTPSLPTTGETDTTSTPTVDISSTTASQNPSVAPEPAVLKKITPSVSAQASKKVSPAPVFSADEEKTEVGDTQEQEQESEYTGCDVYAPVCSKDGVTYTNKCFAKEQNVEIDYVGACIHTSPADDDANGSDDTSVSPLSPVLPPAESSPVVTQPSTDHVEDVQSPLTSDQEPEEEVRTPSFDVVITQNGNDATVNGTLAYYGKGTKCSGPRPFDPVIVRWGDGANEPIVANNTFSARHSYTIKNASYTVSVSVYNSCYGMKTESKVLYFTF